MKTHTYTVTKYDADDCAALDNMDKATVAALLRNLEGGYMPRRPDGYYSGKDLDEDEFFILRYCKALELAAKWLTEGEKA